MARVAGADIPDAKRVEIALTYIYGIGRTRSVEILKQTDISKDIRVKDLTDDQLVAIRDFIEGNFKVEGDLRRDVAADIPARLKSVATKVCVTARAFLCAVSAPRPTLVLARVQSAP